MSNTKSILSVLIWLILGQSILCYLDQQNVDTKSFIPKWSVGRDSLDKLAQNMQQIELESLPNSRKESSSFEYIPPSVCQRVQIVHLLQQDGCQPKAIASFACSGACSSYVQMSTSKIWQHERSCSCCQQTGVQEATFTLDCPSLEPPYRKVKTFAPIDCICRACTDLDRVNLQPQELVEALAGETGKIEKI